jgi:hypothetical protein
MSDFFQILQREEASKESKKSDSSLFFDNKKIENKVKNYKKDKETEKKDILDKGVQNPIWLNIGEAAKIGGIQTKTIRRAIKAQKDLIKYKIRLNRYLIDLRSLILYLHSNRKLKNKLNENGIGQYISEWKK